MILDKLNLSEKFDIIVDGNLVERAKPDPQVFTTGAKLLGVPCENCIVVEDAAAGIEAALAGGMHSAAIGNATKSGKAEYNLESFEDLLII